MSWKIDGDGIIPIGKYKGRKVFDIIEEDTAYMWYMCHTKIILSLDYYGDTLLYDRAKKKGLFKEFIKNEESSST